MPYDTESQSRNADFISIAAERQSTTLGAKGPVKLKNPPAVRPVNLKNPHTAGVSKGNPQPSAQRAVKLKNLKNLRGEAPSTLTPKACPQYIKEIIMITINQLICDFPDGGGRTLRALSVPSFTLADGGMAVITGPSGSGKTTLLHCLSGLLTPTGGTVFIGDICITALTPNERCQFRSSRVGYVFQKPLLLPYLTVGENIGLSASLAGRTVKEGEIEDLLARVGLLGLAGRRADRLSGGQQQRVSFLRAIVRRPAVLLADEPTASLDEENGRKLMDLMLAYQKEAGCFLLCATHDTRVMDRFPVRYDVRKGAFL